MNGLLIKLLSVFLIPECLLLDLQQFLLQPHHVLSMLFYKLFLLIDVLKHLSPCMHEVLHAHLEHSHGFPAFIRDPYALLLFFQVTISNVIDILLEYLIDVIDWSSFDCVQVKPRNVPPVNLVEAVIHAEAKVRVHNIGVIINEVNLSFLRLGIVKRIISWELWVLLFHHFNYF